MRLSSVLSNRQRMRSTSPKMIKPFSLAASARDPDEPYTARGWESSPTADHHTLNGNPYRPALGRIATTCDLAQYVGASPKGRRCRPEGPVGG
jgi:hypothetical protein